MLARGLGSPTASSAGRLFDGVAALVGLASRARFEGEAAMALEFAAEAAEGHDDAYPFTLGEAGPRLVVDWGPAIEALRRDHDGGASLGVVAARFHNMLAEAIVAVARRCGQERVALTGGCFQNAYLSERTIVRLRAFGFEPYGHHDIPPNDGGLSAGQLVAALREQER
jgi:hydrogenase maturation protein HypF